jgi:broad specificity phosphatase PhoE
LAKTIIGLLRHGQTDWNIDFRLQGTTDIPLNQTGIQQALEVAEVFKGTDWHGITSSSLSRAQATARIVAEISGIPQLDIEPLLLERAFGVGEGLTYDEWRELHHDISQIPGCESVEELTARCHRLLDALLESHRGKKVLAVSHGALIRKVIEILSDNTLPEPGQRFQNASLSVIAHTDETGWQIESFNPATHVG